MNLQQHQKYLKIGSRCNFKNWRVGALFAWCLKRYSEELMMMMMIMMLRQNGVLFDQTVTLGQHAIAKLMMNNIFLRSIFTW